MEIDLSKPLECDGTISVGSRIELVRKGSIITITPPPPVPPQPRPKPVLVVPIEYGEPVAEETYLRASGRADIAKTGVVGSHWICKQIPNPSMLTARQLEALAGYILQMGGNGTFELRQALKTGDPVHWLTSTARRVREVMSDE